MKTHLRRFAAGLLVTSILAGPALADPVSAQSGQAPLASSEPQPIGALDSPFANSQIASDTTLEAATAREDMSLLAQSETTSTVSNNSVSGTSTTGDIIFGDTAFQNSGGLTLVNANSGNNVGMNASINVNIVMTPPQQ